MNVRCNRCLTRITADNSASDDKFGKPVCNDCAYCEHNYTLNQYCPLCEADCQRIMGPHEH